MYTKVYILHYKRLFWFTFILLLMDKRKPKKLGLNERLAATYHTLIIYWWSWLTFVFAFFNIKYSWKWCYISPNPTPGSWFNFDEFSVDRKNKFSSWSGFNNGQSFNTTRKEILLLYNVIIFSQFVEIVQEDKAVNATCKLFADSAMNHTEVSPFKGITLIDMLL